MRKRQDPVEHSKFKTDKNDGFKKYQQLVLIRLLQTCLDGEICVRKFFFLAAFYVLPFLLSDNLERRIKNSSWVPFVFSIKFEWK
jgi:hypothetical protein